MVSSGVLRANSHRSNRVNERRARYGVDGFNRNENIYGRYGTVQREYMPSEVKIKNDDTTAGRLSRAPPTVGEVRGNGGRRCFEDTAADRGEISFASILGAESGTAGVWRDTERGRAAGIHDAGGWRATKIDGRARVEMEGVVGT